MKKEDLRIVFFGTPEFAVASLDRLVKGGYNIAGVVTMPDKAAGRGHRLIQSDVKQYAAANGLKILQPANLKSSEFIEQLRNLNADLFIVIAFRMLPEAVWGMPRLGTFNLHASLLPKYRGAAPINRAVMNGDTVTGVTTFFLKHEIDTGDIIEQCSIDILPEDNVGTVHDKLMTLGADMVLHTVNAIIDGNVTVKPQPEGDFTPAPKIYAEDCIINWERKAVDIHNMVRGLSPYPCARTNILLADDKELICKILRTAVTDRVSTHNPGECTVEGNRLYIATADYDIEILNLQPAGKKCMATAAFLNGYVPLRCR